MYCEARTSTGLGCDSLGIEQCNRCKPVYTLTIDRRNLGKPITCNCDVITCTNEMCITHTIPYLMGWDKPNYPVPAIPLIVRWAFKGKDCYIVDKRSGQSVRNLHYPYL